MPPAFSLRKCLSSYYLQGIGASFAATSHLPILYQTRTLRIRYNAQPNTKQATRVTGKGVSKGSFRRVEYSEAEERSSEVNDVLSVSTNHDSFGENDDNESVNGEALDKRAQEGAEGLNINVDSQKQQQDQQGHYQHQQHAQTEPYSRKQPITIPLEPVQSTITPGEQNTFAKLFDMAASGKLDRKPHKTTRSTSATDRGGAEKQEEEMKQLAESVLQRHIPPNDQSIPEFDISKYPEPLRPIVAGRSAGLWEKQQEEKRIQQMKSAMAGIGLTGSIAALTAGPAIPNARFADIVKRMNKANTDFGLWEVLKSNVFNDFEKLGKAGLLERQHAVTKAKSGIDVPSNPPESEKSTKKKDKEEKNKASKTKKKDSQNLPNVDIFRTNYPHLLVAAVQQLRRNFPTSSLALTVLAETKALGLVSYILGASTALYNESLDILWSTYSDLGAVNRLLHEMDNGGIDFDGQTLLLLDTIFTDCTNMAGLPEGKMLGIIWRMDKSVREVRQLGEWRDTVRQRLEAEALRRVREQESEADLIAATL